MRKLCLLFCMSLVSASIIVAQDNKVSTEKRPNLSGVWIPKVEKDKRPDAGPDGWTNVIVEQRDPELKFTLIHPNPDGKTTRKLEFTFYTDGRGETNSGTVYYYLVANGSLPDETIKSTTKWDGSALVIVHRMVTRQGPATISSDLTMRWELSGDGKTLTRTTKNSNFSAIYKLPSGEEKVLTVSTGGKVNEEFKDTYILLKPNR